MINKHYVLKGILFYSTDNELAADASVEVVLDALESVGLTDESTSRESLIAACKSLICGLLNSETTMLYRDKLSLGLAKYFLIAMFGFDKGTEYFEKYVFKIEERYQPDFRVLYLENVRQFVLVDSE